MLMKAAPCSAQSPPFPVRRFSVDEYHQLIDSGVVPEDTKAELLDGWVTPKMTINPPHATVLDLVRDALATHVQGVWRFRVQSPITLATSEPEPDVAVAIGPATRYGNRHPGPADLVLVVEVSDSTLAHDRNAKGRLYANAAIPTYWVVNIVDWCVEVYTQPGQVGYAQQQVYQRGDVIPLVVAGQVVGQVPVVEMIG